MKENKKIGVNKTIIISVALIATILIAGLLYFLVINPAKRKGSDVLSITYTGKTVHQYDEVNIKDFKVNEKGKSYPLDKYNAHVTNPIYMDERVSFNIDGEIYYADVDFIEAVEPIVWTYKGKTSIPKDITEESIDLSELKGKITYTDDTTKEVSPKSVVIENKGAEIILNLSDGLVTYVWDAAIEE